MAEEKREQRRRKYEGVSENPVLKLWARVSVSFAVPILAFVGMVFWTTVEDNRKAIIQTGVTMAVIATKLENNSEDISDQAKQIRRLQRSFWESKGSRD